MPISKGAQGVTGLESKKLVSDDRMEAATASAESEEDDEEDEDGLSDVDEVSGWIIRSATDKSGGFAFLLSCLSAKSTEERGMGAA